MPTILHRPHRSIHPRRVLAAIPSLAFTSAFKLACTLVVTIASIVALQACQKNASFPSEPVDSTADSNITYSNIPTDPNFATGQIIGYLTDPRTIEASALTTSRSMPGYLWTIDDSGNPNNIYLLDTTGALRAIVSVTGANNIDWEAIASAWIQSTNYLYIADIGDNNTDLPTHTIYRIPEPSLTPDSTIISTVSAQAEAITFRYPDTTHNAEAILVDPSAPNSIYIITKGLNATLYRVTFPQTPPDSTIVAQKLETLPIGLVTDADIATTGHDILIKNYGYIYYWPRASTTEPIETTLRHAPTQITYTTETQGESVCWSTDATAYFTTTESFRGATQPLWRYKRR